MESGIPPMIMRKGILALEIGDQSVGYVYLTPSWGGHRIQKTGRIVCRVEASSPGSLREAIVKIQTEEKISPAKITVALTGQEPLIHQITVPAITANELEEVISGEIEKIPSFYHRNFEYFYKSGKTNKEKNKVVYAAMSQNLQVFLFQEIRQTGISLRDVEISPLNLIGILSPRTKRESLLAYLVVNERHSYLGIFANGQYEVIYKSSIGMEQLTSVGNRPDFTPVYANWTSEIKRVLKAYLLSNKAVNIENLWLVWDETAYAGLNEKLARDLDLAVLVQRLDNLAKIKAPENSPFNPIYVLALTPIYYLLNHSASPFELDYFYKSLNVRKFFILTALLAGFLFMAFATVWGIYDQALVAKTRTLSLETKKVSLETEKRQEEAKQLYQKRDDYEKVRERLLTQASYIHGLNRVSWSEVFTAVSDKLPENLALTSFKFSESGQARIRGEAFEMDSIANLIRSVDNSGILEQSKFDQLKEETFEEIRFYSFGIFAKLKNRAGEQK
jgi:Tfp pilus assembly PilM family ATPase/Tfp pilus assembly protein PilN